MSEREREREREREIEIEIEIEREGEIERDRVDQLSGGVSDVVQQLDSPAIRSWTKSKTKITRLVRVRLIKAYFRSNQYSKAPRTN